MRNVAVIAAILFVLGPGCTDSTKQSGSNYETVTADPHRDHEAAQRYHREALRLLDSGQVAEAEKALKRSLEADVRFGPAHNNLGQIYFEQGKLYLAAWEFQYAASLMPKQAEPLNNLGLVLEKGGQIDEAVDRYTEAVKLDPGNIAFVANLARAKARRGDADEELRGLLKQIRMKDSRPEWREWAERQMLRISN